MASSVDAVGRFLADKGLIVPTGPGAGTDSSGGSGGTSPIEAALSNAAASSPSARQPAAPDGLVDRIRSTASDMLITALNFVGVPYRLGGNSFDQGFDCSGFTRQVFETSLGLILPRRADEQAGAPGMVAVERADLLPGDLVFFNTLRRTFSHVGIYLGDGKFIHAPRSGSEVRVDDMRFVYWAERFTGARRTELFALQGAGEPSGQAATPGGPPVLHRAAYTAR